jgi:hypothetical protein
LKKDHTLKTELRTNLKEQIVHVSKSHPGLVHDFTALDQAGKSSELNTSKNNNPLSMGL